MLRGSLNHSSESPLKKRGSVGLGDTSELIFSSPNPLQVP